MRNSELDQQKMAHILLQKLIQKNAEVYDPQTTHMISEVEAMILWDYINLVQNYNIINNWF